ncbi:hypothetical protein PVAND_002314 [Polypedilum vanderplanki]|uniref:Uncharacterized protein n=1 Tax=Polypedilum vanderplanki TaxID=319348 RepID=A0A9J6BQL2_POLVA|nr:hypothetical protein PVAND_002314 [Polypedilum vanderplanki]
MEALDLLEKRIDALSNALGINDEEQNTLNENLTDSIISANTLITSATSGREKVGEMMKRTKELENYLDPDYINDQQSIKIKEAYINTVANDLAANFETLQKIKLLEPTLSAEYFRSIPDVSEKIRDMNEQLSTSQQQNELIEESLLISMQKYSEIQNNLRDALQQLNDRLDKFEERVENAKKKAIRE